MLCDPPRSGTHHRRRALVDRPFPRSVDPRNLLELTWPGGDILMSSGHRANRGSKVTDDNVARAFAETSAKATRHSGGRWVINKYFIEFSEAE
ncbi:unnamed protein product [Macrosiphum euphorbiae]|nr:unnamed protein product [Macrosiphum euphorbiae]